MLDRNDRASPACTYPRLSAQEFISSTALDYLGWKPRKYQEKDLARSILRFVDA